MNSLYKLYAKYYLPPVNIVPQNRCFSLTHLIISSVLFFFVIRIFLKVSKRKEQNYSIKVLKLCAWLMLGLELFRIGWNTAFYGFSLTCFRFDFCNQICMFLPLCVILGDKKIYPYIQLLAIIGGFTVLVYPLWVFYDYAGFHIMALQSMVSHALMLLCGLIMPYASGRIPDARTETRDSLIGLGFILCIAWIMSNLTGENYLIMKSADGLPLLELIPYPWYWPIVLVLFFYVIRHLSIIYQDMLCLSARLPLGSTDLYSTAPLSLREYKELITLQKLKLYRILRPFKYRDLTPDQYGGKYHD